MLTQFKSLPRLLGILAGAILVVAVGKALAMGSFASNDKEPTLKSHLTLYVGEPLLSEGGTVIVASIPIPEAQWRALKGDNWADDDPDNRKRSTLGEGDRLFGAGVSGRANFVEMYYPENGTFGFDFVQVPDANIVNIKTERILVGSGGWTDRATNTRIEWPDMSVIYVSGSEAIVSESHIISDSFNRILNLGVQKIIYEGATIMIPSRAQIAEGTFGEIQ